MIVSNSSPLILLGKQGKLDILKKCFTRVRIPKAVYDEVMEVRESPEAAALKRAIKEGWVTVEKIRISPILHTRNLGDGEKEAISLASKHKCSLLIDDDSAKKYASLFKINAHGTLYVIFIAARNSFASREEALQILKTMISDGFYISIEIYSRFLDLLKQ